MKLTVYGKTPESKTELKHAVKTAGFVYDDTKPDIVISYGGDGTFLKAEQKYPSVPKVLFRYSKICKKCHNLPINHALQLLKKKQYCVNVHNKLKTRIGKTTLYATNDIVVRNINPLHAIRFTLRVNGKPRDGEFIGDGIIASTPFGSTGYYYSATGKTFKKGIGLAFNNTTQKHKPLVLPENAKVKLTLTRGDAHVAADNNPALKILKEGKSITINQSKQHARIISF